MGETPHFHTPVQMSGHQPTHPATDLGVTHALQGQWVRRELTKGWLVLERVVCMSLERLCWLVSEPGICSWTIHAKTAT